MWLQGIAIIIPRLQDEFRLSDSIVGLASSCMFSGMMIGATGWGAFSDSYGRRPAFNLTLLLSTVFGLLASVAPSFPLLCSSLFVLGTGVGGSMPTDGTLFLENLPRDKRYLLTALSVFFAAGSVAAALLGLLILPSGSCPDRDTCSSHQNRGWRYLLASLGSLTGLFLISRLLFFKLWESPKYLVSTGRPYEARVILQRIAAYNGNPLSLSVNDLRNNDASAELPELDEDGPSSSTRIGYEHDLQDDSDGTAQTQDWGVSSIVDGANELFGFSKPAGKEYTPLSTQDVTSASESGRSRRDGSTDGPRNSQTNIPQTVRSSFRASDRSAATVTQSAGRASGLLYAILPARMAKPAEPVLAKYDELLKPYWLRTTVLVWSIWALFSLAFTSFNVYLSKFLEVRLGASNRIQVMEDILLYSAASLPGAIMGAYLIETSLGRIRTMALSTALVAIALLIFIQATERFTIVLSSCSISLAASVSYAAIYAYPPEAFPTHLRATASGTASALSRLSGILAPVAAGALLSLSEQLPFLLAVAIFIICSILMLSLPYETRDRDADAAYGEDGQGSQ
ncbi:Synaptic vesicle transporter SV2 (major facilitator superfamily) [Ceraceosorus bombacis]|uniref:Synaptic vesicle transporter SV2 (Major facilitator superfamily) n=1 Tax=Ceraceosorus bombacis TaxID=401625 RepID=A0A0P1BPJ8_9BASI|nr:Synaptic vesicle transporter SV2 (major facilitator superfamily) [Ceraceosorus bombacis]